MWRTWEPPPFSSNHGEPCFADRVFPQTGFMIQQSHDPHHLSNFRNECGFVEIKYLCHIKADQKVVVFFLIYQRYEFTVVQTPSAPLRVRYISLFAVANVCRAFRMFWQLHPASSSYRPTGSRRKQSYAHLCDFVQARLPRNRNYHKPNLPTSRTAFHNSSSKKPAAALLWVTHLKDSWFGQRVPEEKYTLCRLNHLTTSHIYS